MDHRTSASSLAPPSHVVGSRSTSPSSTSSRKRSRTRVDSWHRFRSNRNVDKIIFKGLRESFASAKIDWKNGWVMEILAALSILVVTGVLALVLRQHDGKPLDDWNSKVTPNTFISICNTLMRVVIAWIIIQVLGQEKWHYFFATKKGLPVYDMQAFEEACRGPDGAFKLLHRCRGSKIALFGAILSLLTLTIDPFSQELVVYPSINKMTDIQILNKVQHYRVSSNDSLPGVLQLGDGTLQTAIISSMTPNPMEIHPNCPSGNCQSEDFSSVAFCTQCLPGRGWRHGNHFTSPSNVSWNLEENDYFTQRHLVFDDWPEMAGVRYPLLGFARPNNVTSDPNAPLQQVEFVECAIAFCVQDYRLNVTNGDTHLRSVSHEFLSSRHPSTPEHLYSPIFANYSVELNAVVDISAYFRKSFSAPQNQLHSFLAQSGDGTNYIVKLASAMSQALLRQTASPILPVYGTAYSKQTIFHVRWPWIILPVLLAFATVILFFIVRHKSQKLDIPLWRSSVLALLYAKIEGAAVQQTQADRPCTPSITRTSGADDPEKGLTTTLSSGPAPSSTGYRTNTSLTQSSRMSIPEDPTDSATWLKTKYQIQKDAKKKKVHLTNEGGRWRFRLGDPEDGEASRKFSVGSSATARTSVSRPAPAHTAHRLQRGTPEVQ